MKYCALSEKGKREHNEDSFFIPKHSEVALAAVADGMGGHKAGSTASSLALDVMVKDICRGGERSPEKLIGRAIDAANAAVFDLSKMTAGVWEPRLYLPCPSRHIMWQQTWGTAGCITIQRAFCGR